MIFAVGNDYRIRAALADAQSFDVHALIANAHAAEAKDAARRIVVNRFRPFAFRLVRFPRRPALVRAVGEDHILQFAFAALVAYRAIQRIIANRNSSIPYALRGTWVCRCARSFPGVATSVARGLQLGRLFDFPRHMRQAACKESQGNSKMTGLRCPCGARPSITSVPGGTVTSRSSIFSVMSFESAILSRFL